MRCFARRLLHSPPLLRIERFVRAVDRRAAREITSSGRLLHAISVRKRAVGRRRNQLVGGRSKVGNHTPRASERPAHSLLVALLQPAHDSRAHRSRTSVGALRLKTAEFPPSVREFKQTEYGHFCLLLTVDHPKKRFSKHDRRSLIDVAQVSVQRKRPKFSSALRSESRSDHSQSPTNVSFFQTSTADYRSTGRQ